MSIPRTARSTTQVSQALISGVVQDSLTGGPPRMPVSVHLIDRDTGDNFPLLKRILGDGTFAFHGRPERAFPLLAHETYRLRVEASASNYGAASVDIDLGPAPNQPELVSLAVPVDGVEDMRVRLFTGDGLPRRDLVLQLDRTPIRLMGRVYRASEHTEPVIGAQVSVADMTTETDTDGRFSFLEPLPVIESVEVQVTADGFQPAIFAYEPDYTKAVNFLPIALVHDS